MKGDGSGSTDGANRLRDGYWIKEEEEEEERRRRKKKEEEGRRRRRKTGFEEIKVKVKVKERIGSVPITRKTDVYSIFCHHTLESTSDFLCLHQFAFVSEEMMRVQREFFLICTTRNKFPEVGFNSFHLRKVQNDVG